MLAKLRVEGLEKRLVEVRHGFTFIEAREERLLIDAIQRGARPVQHFHQAERLKPHGVGDLVEERFQHRGAQVPHGVAPAELFARPRIGAGPQHPGGEHAVEQGLHQRGVEEVRALIALKAHAQRFFERRSHILQRGRVASLFNAGQTVAGIRSEQPGEVLRFGQRRLVGKRAAQIFAQPRSDPARERPRLCQSRIERFFAVRQPVGFKRHLVSGCALTDEFKLTQVGHQHQVVTLPVAANLVAHGLFVRVLVRRFHLHYAALRRLRLSLARPPALQLPLDVKVKVGMPRALICRLHDAEHLRPESRSNRAEQSRQREIRGSLVRGRAGRANPPQIGKKRLYRRPQLLVG